MPPLYAFEIVVVVTELTWTFMSLSHLLAAPETVVALRVYFLD